MCGLKMLWTVFVFAVVAECRHIDGHMDPAKSCMFGNKTVADGKVVMNVPEKCVTLVCKDGHIVERMIGAAGDTGCCERYEKMFPPGFKYPSCISMTCTNGTWIPGKEIDPCCGRCEVYGYSHFTTSDGHRYDWHGFCNYTLVTLTSASIRGTTTTAVYAEMNRMGSCGTLFGQVTFHAGPHTIIKITRDADFKVSQQIGINGETMTVPRNGSHTVTSSSGKHPVLVYWRKDCLVFQGFEITLRYCPLRLDIWTPRNLTNSVNGLCGHFNYNSMDDFTTPTGQVLPLETFPVEYSDKHWRAPAQVHAQCREEFSAQRTTSICNGTTGNKCRRQHQDMESYQRACHNFLYQLYPSQPKIVDYFIPPCVADLCLVAQRDVDFTTSPSAFVTEVLKGYKNITLQHFHDLKVTPPLMDMRTCSMDTTTTIPVDEDMAHSPTAQP